MCDTVRLKTPLGKGTRGRLVQRAVAQTFHHVHVQDFAGCIVNVELRKAGSGILSGGRGISSGLRLLSKNEPAGAEQTDEYAR